MNLVIDVGNTLVKTAVFKRDEIIKIVSFKKTRLLSEIKEIQNLYPIKDAIISSVASISDKKLQKLQNRLPLLQLSYKTEVPFKNLYKSPKTLGVDRIGLVASAVTKYANKNVLVIDAGTCITFDFINDQAQYCGGAISPGIKIRYQSLHIFTAKLPLLEKHHINDFIGSNTENSIHSGIVNGVCNEIDGVINQYRVKYSNLTVVLTGGDANFLLGKLKSSIFANQNFLLEGLNAILNFNKDE